MMNLMSRRNRMGWLHDEMDRILNAILPETGLWDGETVRTYPPLNLWEDADNLYLEAEVPGFKIGDLALSIVGNELRIAGEHKVEEKKGDSYMRRERPCGGFSRTVMLPVEVDAEKVSAILEHGMLTVTLPRAAAAKARRIDVKHAA